MDITIRIQELDKPNKNNRIYTTEAITEAIENAKKRYSDNNPMLGTLGMPEDAFGVPNQTSGIDIHKVSHTIKNLRIEDGYLVGTAKILKTPMGEILAKMLEQNQESMAFRTFGTGIPDPDGTIRDFNIMGVAAIPASDAA